MKKFHQNNAATLIFQRFSEEPDKVVLSCDGQELTGSDVLRRVENVQARLLANDLTHHSRCLVFCGRSTEFWIDVLALWGIGACSIPVEPEIDESRLAYVIEKAEPDAVLGAPDERREFLSKYVRSGDFLLDSAPITEIDSCNVNQSDLATILFTSGSTGEPKGVMLSHRAIIANGTGTGSAFRLQGCKKLFAPVPFRFVSALSHFVATLYSGVTYSGTEDKLLQGEFIERFIDSGADAIGGSPMQARWIAEEGQSLFGKLKWVMSSGDSLEAPVIQNLYNNIEGIQVVAAYGLTEVAGRFCILDPALGKHLAGSVGKPIPGLKISIRDENGVSLPYGESGEIYASGISVFDGYVNDLDKTSACLSENGFATGDIGHIDDDGYVYISGRTDDVFKSGGVKVSTVPIAASLMATGVFSDLAVLQQDDATLGKIPIVFYMAKPNCKFHQGEIMRELRQQLPPGHLPRQFIEVEDIPRTGSGKVRRAELRSRFGHLIASKRSKE